MELIKIKESSAVHLAKKEGYQLTELARLLFGPSVKVHIEIDDAEQKHIDFMQDCGHNSPDDYSVKIDGEGFGITVTSIKKPLPF